MIFPLRLDKRGKRPRFRQISGEILSFFLEIIKSSDVNKSFPWSTWSLGFGYSLKKSSALAMPLQHCALGLS